MSPYAQAAEELVTVGVRFGLANRAGPATGAWLTTRSSSPTWPSVTASDVQLAVSLCREGLARWRQRLDVGIRSLIAEEPQVDRCEDRKSVFDIISGTALNTRSRFARSRHRRRKCDRGADDATRRASNRSCDRVPVGVRVARLCRSAHPHSRPEFFTNSQSATFRTSTRPIKWSCLLLLQLPRCLPFSCS